MRTMARKISTRNTRILSVVVLTNVTLVSRGLPAGLDSASLIGATQHSIDVAPPTSKHAGFTRLDPSVTGIHFTNHVSIEAIAKNRLVEDGSGVAAGDVDNDGRC